MPKEASASYRMAQVATNMAGHYASLQQFEEESRRGRAQAITGAIRGAYSDYITKQRFGVEKERASILNKEATARAELAGMEVDKAKREKAFAESPAGEEMRYLDLYGKQLDVEAKEVEIEKAISLRKKYEAEASKVAMEQAVKPDGSIDFAAMMRAKRFSDKPGDQRLFENELKRGTVAYHLSLLATPFGGEYPAPAQMGMWDTEDSLVGRGWAGQKASPESKTALEESLSKRGVSSALIKDINRTNNITNGVSKYQKALMPSHQLSKFKSIRDFAVNVPTIDGVVEEAVPHYTRLAAQKGVSLKAGIDSLAEKGMDKDLAAKLRAPEETLRGFRERFRKLRAQFINAEGMRSSAGQDFKMFLAASVAAKSGDTKAMGNAMSSMFGGGQGPALGDEVSKLQKDVEDFVIGGLEAAYNEAWRLEHPGETESTPRLEDLDAVSADKAADISASRRTSVEQQVAQKREEKSDFDFGEPTVAPFMVPLNVKALDRVFEGAGDAATQKALGLAAKIRDAVNVGDGLRAHELRNELLEFIDGLGRMDSPAKRRLIEPIRVPE